MNLGLRGKVAIVTGGSRGLGRACCIGLAREGVKVILNDVVINEETEETVEEIKRYGGSVEIVQGDVSVYEDDKRSIKTAIEKFGALDILVNNAGLVPSGTPSTELSLEEWRRVLDVNLNGVFYCSRLALREMKKRKFGRIINISSIAARRGSITPRVHYAASKAGVLGITRTLAREGAPYNVTVNAILPGIVVHTSLEKVKKQAGEKRVNEWLKEIPLGRFGQPEELANVVVFLASEASSYLTGVSLDFNGGQYMS